MSLFAAFWGTGLWLLELWLTDMSSSALTPSGRRCQLPGCSHSRELKGNGGSSKEGVEPVCPLMPHKTKNNPSFCWAVSLNILYVFFYWVFKVASCSWKLWSLLHRWEAWSLEGLHFLPKVGRPQVAESGLKCLASSHYIGCMTKPRDLEPMWISDTFGWPTYDWRDCGKSKFCRITSSFSPHFVSIWRKLCKQDWNSKANRIKITLPPSEDHTGVC